MKLESHETLKLHKEYLQYNKYKHKITNFFYYLSSLIETK